MHRSRSKIWPAIVVALLMAASAAAQQKKPEIQIAPYQPVATTLPQSVNDASFDAFRKRLGEVAVKKDVAGLKGLIASDGFFWKSEKGDRADKAKSGYDNLAAAMHLDATDGSGWDQLASYAFDPTATSISTPKDVICSPADPVFDEHEFETLLKASGTALEDWGYPLLAGIEVRSGRAANAPVIEKLGLHFVRVLADENAGNVPPNQVPTLRVATPSGKTGFIPAYALAPLGNDQLCYRKGGDGWKITGYVGGDP